MFLFQRSLIYHPDSSIIEPAQMGVPEMTVVQVLTDDGLALRAWWHPPRAPRARTLVYFHGNAGHIGYRADKVRPYLDAGYGVLLLAYRGFSGNAGQPSEDGLYLDARAAIEYVASQGVTHDEIVLYGESLGSGVAVQMAIEHDVGAVVLEAPYSSIAEVAQSRFPVVPAYWLVRDRFDSLAKITRVEAPLLVIHGALDQTIPVKYGRRLFERATGPKVMREFPTAAHNDLYEFGAAEAVLSFLGSGLGAR
jgi:fermentation-respiration switch protein FrsA (DUF1100 family)